MYNSQEGDSILIRRELFNLKGRRTDLFSLVSDNFDLARTQFLYDDNELKKNSYYIENGKLLRSSSFFYDNRNRLIKTIIRGPDSSIKSILIINYYKDTLISQTYIKGEKPNKNQIIRKLSYDSLNRIEAKVLYPEKRKKRNTSYYSYDMGSNSVYIYSDKKRRKLKTVKKYNSKSQLIEVSNVVLKRTTKYYYYPDGLLSYSTTYLNGLFNNLVGYFYNKSIDTTKKMFPLRKL